MAPPPTVVDVVIETPETFISEDPDTMLNILKIIYGINPYQLQTHIFIWYEHIL